MSVVNPDAHTLTGAYAADALDEDERDDFEEHLGACAACRQEAAELAATAARLALAVSAPAPDALRARVMAQVQHTRQLAPRPAVTHLDDRRRRWYQQPATAAAALLLVVSGVLGSVAFSQQRQAEQAERRASQVTAIATDPDRIEVTAPVSSGGHGVAVVADGSAILRTTRLPRLPGGQVYQLWVLREQGPQSAGVLGRGGELEALVEDMGSAIGLALTVEPDGGSGAPTSDPVLEITVA